MRFAVRPSLPQAVKRVSAFPPSLWLAIEWVKWLFTLFPRSEERVIERLSDDRVSLNEAMRQCTAAITHPDYATLVGPLFAVRKEGEKVKSDLSVGMTQT